MRKPGIYHDVPIEEYHQEEGISASGVNLLLDCPARYHHEFHGPGHQSSAAMDMGRAVHLLALEPEKFDKSFYVMTESFDRRTKAGKEGHEAMIESARGRTVLRLEDAGIITGMATAISDHPVWKRTTEGLVEQSIYWDTGFFGTRLRARPDFYNDEVVIDVKTTDSIASFQHSIFRFGYHRQAAMQLDGCNVGPVKERTHIFLVVEKKAPYLTSILTLGDDAIERGRQDYLKAADLYTECLQANYWPGYDTETKVISLPKYLQEVQP